MIIILSFAHKFLQCVRGSVTYTVPLPGPLSRIHARPVSDTQRSLGFILNTEQPLHAVIWSLQLTAACTATVMAGIAVLGFHPTIGTQFPSQSDKLLHFFGFAIMSASFYWVFSVPEESLQDSWYWKNFPTLLTAIVWFSKYRCLVCTPFSFFWFAEAVV